MYNDRPSATALLIARSQAMLAETMPWAVDGERDAYYRAFASEVAGKDWKPAGGARAWLKIMERFSIPGLYLHQALRKLRIEVMVRELLDTGREAQVVVLGAGFDPLAAILHRQYPSVLFLEVDHPATQAPKQAALEKIGYGGNLRFVPADLAYGSLEGALKDTGYDPEKPTLFIAEGLTMYLDPRQIDKLLRQMHAVTFDDDSYFLFTYMVKSYLGTIGFDTQSWTAAVWLSLKNESFKWGIEPEELSTFLAARHYSVVKTATGADLSAKYLQGRKLKLARGENICLAKMVKG